MVSCSLQKVMTGKLKVDMFLTIHSVTLMYSDAFLALVLPWNTNGSALAALNRQPRYLCA